MDETALPKCVRVSVRPAVPGSTCALSVQLCELATTIVSLH